MKKSFLNLVFVLFGLNLLAQQTKILSSKIISIDVFRNEAQIKREARIALEPGEFELVFEKISSKLSSESIEVLAPEGVDVLSVSKKNYYLTEEDKPAEIIALQDSIQIVKDQLNNLRWEREAVQIQKDLLLSNKQIGGNGVGVKADELEDVLGVFQRKLLEFKLENSRIEKSEKELLLIKTILDKQYNEFNSGKIGLNNQILVQVKVNKSIPQAKFELQYMVRGVSWKPSYDIRVKDSQSPIQFVLKAGITQSTGENWNGVSMKLSSANPQIGGNKPDLNTQFIS
ncbi:MAG: mucoidy inhibitor MuiA family protein, partial [Bacteroidia bacterium]